MSLGKAWLLIFSSCYEWNSRAYWAIYTSNRNQYRRRKTKSKPYLGGLGFSTYSVLILWHYFRGEVKHLECCSEILWHNFSVISFSENWRWVYIKLHCYNEIILVGSLEVQFSVELLDPHTTKLIRVSIRNMYILKDFLWRHSD